MERYLWIVVAVVAFAWLWYSRRPDTPAAEAHRLVEAGALLLDVRSPGEFSSQHLPGAVNIPVGELAARTGELGDPTRPVVVYCQSGMRSAKAKKILGGAGFGQVHNLGGIGNW